MNKPVMPVSSLSAESTDANPLDRDYRLAASRLFRRRLRRYAEPRAVLRRRMSSPIPCATNDPWLTGGDRLGQDHRLPRTRLGLGLGVAESMDTAQRGNGAGLADLAGS
jgi:hypothetical protein